MTAPNGRLDTAGTLSPGDGDEGAWAPGEGRGQNPSPASALGSLPAPPPPPQLSRKALQETIRQGKRELRTSTFRSLVQWVTRQHRAWYWFFGVVGVLFMGSLFALWFTGAMVRAATVETETGPTATSVVYRASMPNPLNRVKLTPDAAVILGAHDSDGDGKMDALDDVKSSAALVAILQETDLCAWFISVDVSYAPVMSKTPSPGARPLASCADPIITPTTVAPATTAPAPTTTAAPAK